jgi:hypothetical protein
MSNIKALQVMVSNTVEKTSKAGKPYKFLQVQGLATMEDGTQSMFRFDLWPERDQPLPQVPLGQCVPILGLRVHWETAKLEPAVTGFRPVPVKTA